MGSRTPKPTELLCVNLPHMLSFLHQYRVRTELPRQRAVGKDAQGHWHTTCLKEYAPAFCKAIAASIRSAFDECDIAEPDEPVPADFIQLCRSMQVHCYGVSVGQDYAG